MSRDRLALRASRPRGINLLLALLLLITGLPLADTVSARQADGEMPVDLAAMVLRPSDFEAEGLEMMGDYRMPGGQGEWRYRPTGHMILPEAVAEGAVAGTPDELVGELMLDLEEAGWRQQFRTVLTSPGDTTPIFVSSVAEYADEDGADEAFELLTDTDSINGVQEIDESVDVGDESVVHRDRSGFHVPNGDRTTVTFRFDRFIGTFRVYEYRDLVEAEVLEALSERTIERIEQVLNGELGGLSHLALRLDIGVSPFIERYDLLDEDFLPLWDDTAEEREAREASFGPRTDSYRLDQSVPLGSRELYQVPRYAVIISRFEDEEAAADAFDEIPTLLEQEPLDDAVEFGEQSFTFTEEFDWGGVTRAGFRIYARVGDISVNMVIDAPGDAPDLETLEDLMGVQLECLEDGACPAQPIPAEILDYTCATGPVDAADDSLDDEIEGEAPMAGGDAAQTGEQAGPGPDGDPDLLWRFQTAGTLNVAPVVVGGLVILGAGNSGVTNGGDGNIYALDAASGERAWCIPTGGSIPPTFAYANGMLVGAMTDPRVQVGNGSALVALDPETGEEQWRVYVGGYVGNLLIDDEAVFVRTRATVTVLDLETGEARWRFTPEDHDDGAFTSAAVADGVLYLNYYTGYELPKRIYALDAETGEQLWVFDDLHEEQHFSGGPVVADGLVFVGASDGGLYALDADEGEEVWRFGPEIEAWDGIEDGGMSFNAPAVIDGVVYVGTGATFDEVEDDGYLFAVDAESGEELWRYETGDPLLMQPSIADGAAYVGDLTGLLYAVDIESGEERWTFELEGELGTSSPAVVDGVLYITDRDRSLYAIAGDER